MKPKYSLLLIILSLIIPVNVFAASRTITVNWSMPNSTVGDIKDYILNYSTNSDMSGATQQSCEPWQQTGSEGDQTTFSMTCNNVPIVTGQIAYFTLEAIKTDGSSLTSSVFTKDTKITLVQNFTVLTPGPNQPPRANIVASTTSGPAPLTVHFSSSSKDPDGTITSYEWNFGDGSPISSEQNPSHTYSNPGSYRVTLVVKDDQGAISQAASTTINVSDASATPTYAINFQPADAPVPDGFAVDSGEAFDSARGYGWTAGPASWGARDRNDSSSPDQSYDTMIHVAPDSVWEINIPNGDYSVTICMGDPSYPTGTQNVQVEGVNIINQAVLSSTVPWVEKTAAITVIDGKLTVTFTGSTDPARMCWIKIEK